jgi:pyridoxal phosphate enzyme (YggS family)
MTDRRIQLEENLRSVEAEIAQFSPTLIVVTKTYPVSDVEILRELGVDNFGENRSSEGLEKSRTVSGRWHYQGEIQSKKIREILSWAQWIHSLDSARHAQKIHRTLEESNSEISVFLQLSLDGDPERGGVVEDELFSLAEEISSYSTIKIQGLMSVPPVSAEAEGAFGEIARVHGRFKAAFPSAQYLSAGMSGDYMIALNHGATHIRVGSKILGSRQYH